MRSPLDATGEYQINGTKTAIFLFAFTCNDLCLIIIDYYALIKDSDLCQSNSRTLCDLNHLLEVQRANGKIAFPSPGIDSSQSHH